MKHCMTGAIRSILLSFCLALTDPRRLLSQDDYAAAILAGISNQGQNQAEPYVTAGDRTYLIGTQDGSFPDLGDHVPGEMGGLWLHPIKLIDGFWAHVTDKATNQDVALSESTEFVNYPHGSRFRYGPVLDSMEVERFQFSPDGQPGLIVQYTFRNAAGRKRQLNFQFSVKTDLSPVWFSDRLGIKDARDTVAWQSTKSLFIAQDTNDQTATSSCSTASGRLARRGGGAATSGRSPHPGDWRRKPVDVGDEQSCQLWAAPAPGILHPVTFTRS
jgi:hypothetical protein